MLQQGLCHAWFFSVDSLSKFLNNEISSSPVFSPILGAYPEGFVHHFIVRCLELLSILNIGYVVCTSCMDNHSRLLIDQLHHFGFA